jgi:hypothetical protein
MKTKFQKKVASMAIWHDRDMLIAAICGIAGGLVMGALIL